MNKIFCDICGKEIEIIDHKYQRVLIEIKARSGRDVIAEGLPTDGLTVQKDLCKACAIEFYGQKHIQEQVDRGRRLQAEREARKKARIDGLNVSPSLAAASEVEGFVE